jgi:hypothetical protein
MPMFCSVARGHCCRHRVTETSAAEWVSEWVSFIIITIPARAFSLPLLPPVCRPETWRWRCKLITLSESRDRENLLPQMWGTEHRMRDRLGNRTRFPYVTETKPLRQLINTHLTIGNRAGCTFPCQVSWNWLSMFCNMNTCWYRNSATPLGILDASYLAFQWIFLSENIMKFVRNAKRLD